MTLDPDIWTRAEQGRASGEDYRALAALHRELAAAAACLAGRFAIDTMTAADKADIGGMLAYEAETQERVAFSYEELGAVADLRAAKAGAVAP